MAQHCSFVEPKHLSIDGNIYAQVEAKCLSFEEVHCLHIKEKRFSFFEEKHSCVDKKEFDRRRIYGQNLTVLVHSVTERSRIILPLLSNGSPLSFILMKGLAPKR